MENHLIEQIKKIHIVWFSPKVISKDSGNVIS